jgi:hypothetical protein
LFPIVFDIPEIKPKQLIYSRPELLKFLTLSSGEVFVEETVLFITVLKPEELIVRVGEEKYVPRTLMFVA